MNIFIGSQEFVFSFLYDDFIEQFQSTRTLIGWAYSMHWIFFTLPSLLVSPLIDKYGCRKVAIGSFVTICLGYSAAGFSPNFTTFSVLFGVVAGFGSGAAFLAASTAIQLMFLENRQVAAAVTSTGFALSALVVPIYTKLFQDAFGTMGSLVLHGGLCFHGTLLAFVLRDTNEQQKGEAKNTNDISDDKKEMSTAGVYIVENDLESSEAFRYGRSSEETSRSVSGDHRQVNSHQSKSKTERNNKSGMLSYLRDVVDVTLFRNITFIVALTHVMLYCLGRYGILAQFVSAAKYRGFSSQKAAYLLTISGFGNLVGSIVVIIIVSLTVVDPVLTSILTALLVTSCAFMIAFSTCYLFLAIAAAIIGAEEALFVTNIPLLVVHIVGVENVARGVAILLIFLMVASLAAAPFTGWLVEISARYLTCFVAMGAVGSISTMLGIIVFVVIRKRKCKKTKEATHSSYNSKSVSI